MARLVGSAAKRAGIPLHEVRHIRDAVNVIWVAIAVVGVLSVLGVTSEFTTLIFWGIGWLALTLALQSTLQNIIAGLMLFRDKTLRLDDQIEYGGIKGQVVRLGLRNTWVRAERGSTVIVSNSFLAGGPLTQSHGHETTREEAPSGPLRAGSGPAPIAVVEFVLTL